MHEIPTAYGDLALAVLALPIGLLLGLNLVFAIVGNARGVVVPVVSGLAAALLAGFMTLTVSGSTSDVTEALLRARSLGGIPMTTWTNDELERIGDSQELQLASERPGGTLRPYVTMWVVRAGDELYVRSAYGPTNPWFRRAKANGVGRIRAGGVERDVTFAEAAPGAHAAIDAAYHAKYDRYGPKIVDTVVGPEAEAVTVRLVPRAGRQED